MKETCLIFLLLLCVRLSLNASLSLHEQRKYKSLIEGQGLYSGDDDVEVLTSGNFKKRVYGQKSVWLVEFYNSWCGFCNIFCQRFAPSWKALATDVKAWRNVVNIAAMDCSDEDNSPLCRELEIMGYPTLRYFHENYTDGVKNIGEEVRKGSDMEEHKDYLIKHMISEQENNRGLHIPTLLPYTHTNRLHLFDGPNVNAKFVFLLIDLPGGTLGPQLSLDFHNYKQISVRYASAENEDLVRNVQAKKFPFLMVLTDQNQSHIFPEGSVTREALRSAMIDYLKPYINIAEEVEKPDIFKGKWIDVKVPDISTLMEAKSRRALRDKVRKMGDVVFQADLESALRYSLKNEIGIAKDITGEKLVAVKNYLDVLNKSFPFGPNGRVFLMELADRTRGRNSIHGSEIAEIVTKYDDDSKRVFSSAHQWIACEGSSPQRRGYPCGLWKLFHYLTVQAAERNDPATEVLEAMHGYIKNFFGCADCSQHFQEMALHTDMKGVTSSESAVLWLWMAHNEVNKRLAGDITEDPEFPKVPFPASENCPKCRGPDNSWDLNEVLKYIKNVYSSVNIRYIGADSSVLHPSLNSTPRGVSSVFEQIDASMCFILYLLSFALIIVLIRVFLKKGYRKKMYAHDLLGKV